MPTPGPGAGEQAPWPDLVSSVASSGRRRQPRADQPAPSVPVGDAFPPVTSPPRRLGEEKRLVSIAVQAVNRIGIGPGNLIARDGWSAADPPLPISWTSFLSIRELPPRPSQVPCGLEHLAAIVEALRIIKKHCSAAHADGLCGLRSTAPATRIATARGRGRNYAGGTKYRTGATAVPED